MKKKKTVIRCVVITLISLVTAAVIAGGICTALTFRDNIRDKYTLTETDDSFLWSALKAALRGSTFDATEVQVNTYLNDTFCGEDKVLKNVRVYFYENKPCEIYARILYHNHDHALFSRAELSFDGEEGVVGVRFHDVKLGELPIAQPITDSIVKNFADSHELTEFRDNVLYVRTRYDYQFDDFSFHLNLKEFEPHEGSIRCRTNSLTREILTAIKDYLLSENGQELVKRLFGETTNNIKNFVLDYFF